MERDQIQGLGSSVSLGIPLSSNETAQKSGILRPSSCFWIAKNGVKNRVFFQGFRFVYKEMDDSVNVFGEELLPCSQDPVTGFFRDGCCNTSSEDRGSHTVCVQVNEAFLLSQAECGNDLITPMPVYRFPGLKPGDRWCLCASRWLESYRHGVAPKVYLESTHKRALEIIPLEILERFAAED